MYEITCFDLDGNTINNFFQWDVDQKIVIKVTGCEDDYLRIAPEVHFANVKKSEALVTRSWLSGRVSSDHADIMKEPSESSEVVGVINMNESIVYTPYAEYTVDNNALIANTTYVNGDKDWCVVEYNNEKRYVKSSCIERSLDTIISDVPNVLLQEQYPLLIYVYLTDSDDISSQKTILYSELPVRKRAKPSDYEYVENITRITANEIKDEIEYALKETRDEAIALVTERKNDFINAGEMLVGYGDKTEEPEYIVDGDNQILVGYGDSPQEKSARWYRNQAKAQYDSIFETASNTANNVKTTIETDINNLMLTDGLEMKFDDDGVGNVTMKIVISQV